MTLLSKRVCNTGMGRGEGGLCRVGEALKKHTPPGSPAGCTGTMAAHPQSCTTSQTWAPWARMSAGPWRESLPNPGTHAGATESHSSAPSEELTAASHHPGEVAPHQPGGGAAILPSSSPSHFPHPASGMGAAPRLSEPSVLRLSGEVPQVRRPGGGTLGSSDCVKPPLAPPLPLGAS